MPLQDLFVLCVVDEGILDNIVIQVHAQIHHVIDADESPTYTLDGVASQLKPGATS